MSSPHDSLDTLWLVGQLAMPLHHLSGLQFRVYLSDLSDLWQMGLKGNEAVKGGSNLIVVESDICKSKLEVSLRGNDLCAMTRTDRWLFFMARSSASCTAASLLASKAEVASSRISSLGSRTRALARAIRCLCPPDNRPSLTCTQSVTLIAS